MISKKQLFFWAFFRATLISAAAGEKAEPCSVLSESHQIFIEGFDKIIRAKKLLLFKQLYIMATTEKELWNPTKTVIATLKQNLDSAMEKDKVLAELETEATRYSTPACLGTIDYEEYISKDVQFLKNLSEKELEAIGFIKNLESNFQDQLGEARYIAEEKALLTAKVEHLQQKMEQYEKVFFQEDGIAGYMIRKKS